MKSGFGCLGLMIFFVLSLLVASVLNGWVLTMLWGWFVVPTFPNIPSLALIPAIGIAMTMRFLIGQYKPATTEESEKNDRKLTDEEHWENIKKAWGKWTEATFQILMAPLMILLFGWILHFFM